VRRKCRRNNNNFPFVSAQIPTAQTPPPPELTRNHKALLQNHKPLRQNNKSLRQDEGALVSNYKAHKLKNKALGNFYVPCCFGRKGSLWFYGRVCCLVLWAILQVLWSITQIAQGNSAGCAGWLADSAEKKETNAQDLLRKRINSGEQAQKT